MNIYILRTPHSAVTDGTAVGVFSSYEAALALLQEVSEEDYYRLEVVEVGESALGCVELRKVISNKDNATHYIITKSVVDALFPLPSWGGWVPAVILKKLQ